jgi:hypothetical protein
MTEVLDYSLFGEVLIKPATGETATPTEALKGKVVSAIGFDWSVVEVQFSSVHANMNWTTRLL